MATRQKTLIHLGLVLLLAGLLWPWLSKLSLGRRPGDIIIDRPGLKVYLPITTMLPGSFLVSPIAWLFKKC